MPTQLTFDLPLRVSRERGDFFVSDSNAAALGAIDAWQSWEARKLLLTGPPGAGKSHLAHLWAEQAEAVVIDARDLSGTDPATFAGRNLALENTERLADSPEAQTAAFHLHNLILAEGGHLLITAATAPSRWGLSLPDLASRMQGTQLVRIDAPDEALLTAVLLKHFADRQIDAPANLIQYLVPRIDRSFRSAGAVVARLDALALSEGRSVSRALATRLLANDGREGGKDLS